MSKKMNRQLSVLGAAAIAGAMTVGFAAQAVASETRSYVVRWFHYANYNQEGDCPNGLNPTAEGTFRRILKERNTPPAQIEKLMENFPYSMYDANIGMRGIIDGKPANPYLNPTSTKDPNLHLNVSKVGLGFNLDGKIGPNDFTDAETGEKGVDNMLARVTGCTHQLSSAPGKLPTFPEIQWDMTRDHSPAWLIEIAGIDDYKNDDDVVVSVFRAQQPITRSGNGLPQPDMTYTPEFDPRTAVNTVHGKIKNGLLVTNNLEFFMPGEPFSQAEYSFKEAKMRFRFNDDGSLHGLVGGYHKWRTIYVSWALGGSTYEINAGYDIPGLYYALKKTADAYPDGKTGENTFISSAYIFDAIPAFIQHSAKTADAR